MIPLLAALLAVPVQAFDDGVDASALLSQARQTAAETPVPENKRRRSDVDCRVVSFRADSGTVSPTIHLRSQEWVEECRPAGDPRHGGVICTERPGIVHRREVSIHLSERRPLLPWEYDAFEACLDGYWLRVRQLESAYKYRVSDEDRAGRVAAVPVAKTPMSPDPVGVVGELAEDLTLSLRDRWARYYAGERIVFKLELKRHVPIFPDATLVEKELELPVAETYSFDFKSWAGEFSQALESGKEYYAAYSIKRVGQVSKPVFTRKHETGKVTWKSVETASL